MGTGHSGSTLIDLILGSHSRSFSLGEFSWVSKNLDEDGKLVIPVCSICGDGCVFWDHKASLPLLETYFKHGNSKNPVVRKVYGRTASARVNIYEKLFEWSGADVLVDSSKAISWIRRQLLPWWHWKNQSPFLIYIYRDGRAVVNSYKRKYPDTNVRVFAKHWIRLTGEMERYYQNFPSDRKMRIPYERLATAPAETAGDLCRLLKIEYEPAMLQYWTHDHHIVHGNSRTRSLIYNYRNSHDAGPHATEKHPLGIELDLKWKRELNEDELKIFQTVAGDINRTYAYEPRFVPPHACRSLSAKTPRASVIVVTRDRANSLDRTLEALRNLDYPDYDVLVVDNGSCDHTKEVIRRHGTKFIFCPSERGIGACRQAGVLAATGEIIAFCDDDCVPNSDWLSNLVQRLQEPNAGIVAGQVVNIGFPDNMQRKGRSRHLRNGKLAWAEDYRDAEFFGNMNLAFRKEIIQRIGGYDSFFNVMEEIDLQIRVRKEGFDILYEPDAVLTHHYTGMNYKKRHLVTSIPMVRLYLCMKHFRPSTFKEWSSFLFYETKLFAEDLQKIAIGFGGATVKGNFHRMPEIARATFQTIASRMAIPWLLYRARKNKVEKQHEIQQQSAKAY